MRKKLLVLIAVVATMLAALAGVASAGSASGPSEKAGPVYFKTKVTPGTGVRSGQTLPAKSPGAIKRTAHPTPRRARHDPHLPRRRDRHGGLCDRGR